MKGLIGNFFLFLLLFYPTANAGVVDLCHTLFKRNLFPKTIDDLGRLDRISKIEKRTQFLRSLKENPTEIEVNRRILRKWTQIETQITQGHFSFANRQWRPLFRNVEVNYAIVRKQEELVSFVRENMRNMNFDDLIIALQSRASNNIFFADFIGQVQNLGQIENYLNSISNQMRKRLKIIGSNYNEYIQTRSKLEAIATDISCQSSCKNNIQQLLDTMGISSRSVRTHFPQVLYDVRKPSLEAIREFVHSHPVAYETRLIKEASAELQAVLRDFVTNPAIKSSLLSILEKRLPRKSNFFTTLFNLLGDTQARVNHFPHINRIIRNTQDVREKMFLLRDLDAGFDNNALLISFKRRADKKSSDTWDEIYNYAKDNNASFYNAMTHAQDIAERRGPLSIEHPRSIVGKISLLISSGVATIVYLSFDADEDIKEVESPPVLDSIDDNNSESGEVPEEVVTVDREELNAFYETFEELTEAIKEFKDKNP